jgi:hypothetical protein
MASIIFDATLTTDKLDKAVLESKRKIGQWSKDIEKSTENVDVRVNRLSNTFDKQGKSTERVLRREKGLIEDIRETIQRYEKAREKAWKVESIEKYNQKIAEAKQHLKEYEEAGVKASKEAENFNQKIGKWILSFGGAVAILMVLKKTLLETTAGINAFNYASEVTKQILYNLTTGAGSLASGLREVIEAQRILNDLRLEEKISNYEAMKERILFQKYSVEAHDQMLTTIERIEAYDKAIEANTKMVKLQIETIKKQRDAIRDMLEVRPGSEKLKLQFIDLNTEILRLESMRYSRLKEMTSMQSGLVKKEAEDQLKWRENIHNGLMKMVDEYWETQEKYAKKLKELDNQIALNKLEGKEKELLALEHKYEQDIETYKDSEAIKSALAEKYAQERYLIEMKYLDQIKEENRKIADTLLKLEPGAYSIFGWERAKKPSPLKPTIQTREDIDKQREANLQKEVDLRKQIVYEASNFVYQLGEAVGLSEESLEALNGMLNTIDQLIQGNFIGAAFSILARAFSVFGQMRDIVSEPKWKKQIEAWDALIERQKRVIELSERTGGTEKALRDAVALAQKELDDINAAIAQARERRGIPTQELLDAQQRLRDELFDAQQALNDFITGGINQIDIAGVIAQGFKDGKRSARDFTEDFNDLMRNAINTSLEELSKPSITAWYKKFAADMASAGGLDAIEIVALKKQWDDIIAAEEERRKQIYAIAGITETAITHPGLTRQIRRDITEETGTELAALFRRYADEQRVVKDYSIQGVTHLVGIETNTYETVEELKNAVIELQAININTKQVPVGGLG